MDGKFGTEGLLVAGTGVGMILSLFGGDGFRGLLKLMESWCPLAHWPLEAY